MTESEKRLHDAQRADMQNELIRVCRLRKIDEWQNAPLSRKSEMEKEVRWSVEI